MSLKRKIISAATSALAVVAFTTFASAQDTTTQPTDSAQQQQQRQERRGKHGFGSRGMRGGKHGGDKMMLRALGQLNLSDAQKQQLSVINENFKTATQTQREEMRALAMKKRDGIINADEQARAKELKSQLRASGEQMQTSILAILTAEQRTQLDQIKAERQQKMIERRQNRQNQTAPSSEVN